MAGTPDGAIRAAARRLGLTEQDYRARLAAGEKWCGGCRDWHPRDQYATDRSRGDGLKSRCRKSDERTDAPTRRQRQEQRARGFSWCSHCRAWLAVDVVRGGLCRKHIRSEARRIYAAGGFRTKRGITAARRRGVAALGSDTQAMLLEATGGLCAYGCGRSATTFDHVIPVKLGGKTEPGNMVPACRSCNSSKNANDPLPWIERMSDDAIDLVIPGLLYDGALLDWLDRAA